VALVVTAGPGGAIVVAADDPAGLARFYPTLLDVEPQPGLSASHWRVPWPPGGWLKIDQSSRCRPQPRRRAAGRSVLWAIQAGGKVSVNRPRSGERHASFTSVHIQQS